MLERYIQNHQHPVNKATHMIGIPALMLSLPLTFFAPVWGLGLFCSGFALQLIGHAFEGSPPSFIKDPRFVLVGARWFFRKLLGRSR